MDRLEDIAKNCRQIQCGDVFCNHVGFADRYDWGYLCGNCGAVWEFKPAAIQSLKESQDGGVKNG